jgi:hypothetical protein
MAGQGRTVLFHGAFNRKTDAERKAAGRPGYRVKAVKIRGKQRWAVMDGSESVSSGLLRIKL